MKSEFVERLLARSVGATAEIRPRASTIFEPVPLEPPDSTELASPSHSWAEAAPSVPDVPRSQVDAGPAEPSHAAPRPTGELRTNGVAKRLLADDPTRATTHLTAPPPLSVSPSAARVPSRSEAPRQHDRAEARTEVIRAIETALTQAPSATTRLGGDNASLPLLANGTRPPGFRPLFPEPSAADERSANGHEAVVEVSIGRIEVRAVAERAAKPTRRRAPAPSAVRLEEHLRQRAGEVR